MALQFPDVDEDMVERIVDKLKSQGIFDQFRKDCLADVDSRPAYHNLKDKVNGAVADFLSKQPWKNDLNKNKVRESLRKHVQQSYLESGVNRIVEQVVNPKIFSIFMSKVEDVVYQVMGLDKPTNSEDRSHNRLRMLLSNMPANPADSLSEMLPSDLDPVSPGSINESGNESANLNDSITSKTIDETDNISRDINKESNLDVNEASNDSKLSGISDLSSHGSTTKLDISESAHLPGDKTETNCGENQGGKRNSVEDDKSKQSANEPVTGGGFDFDNFSNLKEKLMKSDPLNKNVIDKERVELVVSSTNVTDTILEPISSEYKNVKEDSMAGTNSISGKIDKNPNKSPVSLMYSEDSLGSNCSQRKIQPLNESTRNSMLECEDSSVFFMDKKFNEGKDHETVSGVESFREESQLSVMSNDSRRANNVTTLKSINDNSRDVSEVSSPDFSKQLLDVKKKSDDKNKRKDDNKIKNKDDEKDQRKHSSHSSSNRSERYKNKYDHKERSRDSSKDRRYGKDKKSHDYKDRDKNRSKDRESSRKDYSSSRDKYSSRSKDDKQRDSKSDKDRSRHSDKRSYEDSKRDSKVKDSKHLNQDYKTKNEKDSSRLDEDRKSSGSKDSRNSSDDDKIKHHKESDKNKIDKENKSVSDESKKSFSEKSKDIKSNEDQRDKKYVKHSNDQKSSSTKEKDSKIHSDDEKNTKNDNKINEDYKNLKIKEKEDKKIVSTRDKDSKNVSDRKNSSSDDKNTKREKTTKSYELIKEKNSKEVLEDSKINKLNKDNKHESYLSSDKLKNNEEKELSEKEKRKISNSSDIFKNKDEKKTDKESRKKKREHCNEEINKREYRRSRDRDDGDAKNNGKSSEDKKDKNKISKSSSDTQDNKVNTYKKKRSKEASDEEENEDVISNDIDLILERIGSSIKEEERDGEGDLPIQTSEHVDDLDEEDINYLETPKVLKLDSDTYELMHESKSDTNHLENCGGNKEMDEHINIIEGDSINIEVQNKELNTACILNNSEQCNLHNLIATQSEINNKSETSSNINSPIENNKKDITFDSNFSGFDEDIIQLTLKTTQNFDSFMLSTYNWELSSNLVNDKCISMTDNNLNNINLKEVSSIGTESEMDVKNVCKNSNTLFNLHKKNSPVLSPVTKRIVNAFINEGASLPEDSVVSQVNTTCKMDSPKAMVARITRRTVDVISEPSVSFREIHQEKLISEDGVSLNDSSSSEQCFTLPTLTEDMLDNFMKENITDKAEDCYASSESEKDDNSGVSSQLLAETPKKRRLGVKTKIRRTVDKKSLQSSSQRYSSTDLYKPRPLISNSSRRNRVPNKNETELARGTKRSSDSMEFSENKKPR